MSDKITSDMPSISIRTFLKAVEGKKIRTRFFFYKDKSLNKSFSVACIDVNRLDRDGGKLTFLFDENWLLVQIKSDRVQRFYHGDILCYRIEADGANIVMNIL